MEEDNEIIYIPYKQRKLMKMEEIEKTINVSLLNKKKSTRNDAKVRVSSPTDNKKPALGTSAEKSLLTTAREIKKQTEELKKNRSIDLELLHAVAEEKRVLDQIQRNMKVPLIGVKEKAKGDLYAERYKTEWNLPSSYQNVDSENVKKLQDQLKIEVYGNDVPPPIDNFEDMQFPSEIIKALKKKNIFEPTRIQMQAIPIVCLGRDMIGVASTGSGKTLVFVLPMILRAMEAELREPLIKKEGPIGLVICPSRELASQTWETFEYYADALSIHNFPQLRINKIIGGAKFSDQMFKLKQGSHIVIATPGRLNDLLDRREISLIQCNFLVLDEADRLIDCNFEEDIRQILDFCTRKKQTLLFSATMPRRIQDFAQLAIIDPIVVTVGNSGSANLNVEQQVEYVKEDCKLFRLLDCLQKTSPPTMIFCRNKKVVDDVYEYLLLKNVEAIAIHAGMSQSERQNAIDLFKKKRKDILIGTDVVSKGLDFPDIQHVINFDMPKEIENYIHRIGRTGRQGKKGLATTFINRLQDETTLLDLKALLIEANQKIPLFMESLQITNRIINGEKGCAYCGGLGHRITRCPKLNIQKKGQKNSDQLTNVEW